jgi:hypothetical protein
VQKEEISVSSLLVACSNILHSDKVGPDGIKLCCVKISKPGKQIFLHFFLRISKFELHVQAITKCPRRLQRISTRTAREFGKRLSDNYF